MNRLALVTLLLLAACRPRPLHVEISATTLVANGYDEANILIAGPAVTPEIAVVGDGHLSAVAQTNHHWQATLTASVNPGPVTLLIRAPGYQPATRTVVLTPQTSDGAGDGTPDFLRLDDDTERLAFRRWFTFLAEVQYFNPRRPLEISDCSALLRYAYREALRNHNQAWSSEARLPLLPAIPSIRKYAFPHTPLGPNLFRTRGGTYLPSDVATKTFTQFADVDSLSRFNTFFITRDIGRAQPGDLIFFRRNTKPITYHSMIFIGRSQVNRDNEIYVVYHTGPEGTNNPGEIRRLTINQLLHFPDPQWQPIAANTSFLGVYRWNILKAIS